MSEAIEKVARALGHPHNTAARDDAQDALSTLTPGTRWVAADGREMVVVPASGFDWIMSHLRSELHLHKARNPCFVSGQKAANISAMIAAASEGS